jgi:hypothetical protein
MWHNVYMNQIQNFHEKLTTTVPRLFVCSSICFGFFVMVNPVSAQIETIENGGIIDRNTQIDNEDSDETDLDQSKYTPEDLSAQVQGDGSIRLRWSDEAKDEDGYKVQRKRGSGSWQSIADLGKSTESFTDRSTVADAVYAYRVKAYNGSSETEYSDSVTTTTPPPSTEEILGNDVVQAEIAKSVQDSVQEKEDLISNLEQELRLANEDLKKSTEQLEQTQACSIDVIPEKEIERVVDERCQRLPGANAVEVVTQKTTTLISDFFASTKGRLIMSGIILFAVLNNVLWHVTHRSVRKKLHHHRNEHHRLRDLLHPDKD